MLIFFLIVIFLAVFGCTMMDSLWGNTLRLVNLIFSATIATTFGEPVAAYLENLSLSPYFFYNFIGVWFVFVLAYAFFRFATQQLSRVNVKFDPRVNKYGGKAVAALTAWVFVCFALFTMHQAPLGEKFMFGGFTPQDRMFFGLAPDRQWHDYMCWVSKGVYFPGEENVFDPKDDYYKRYAGFRRSMEMYVKKYDNKTGVGSFSELTPSRNKQK